MRFPIGFTRLGRMMGLLGLSPGRSWVEVDDGRLRVRMGWAFSLDTSLATVLRAERDGRRVRSRGVHGWRGKWLVNGSSAGLVRIDLTPPAHARTGPLPITVRELLVSVEDPQGLESALHAAGAS